MTDRELVVFFHTHLLVCALAYWLVSAFINVLPKPVPSSNRAYTTFYYTAKLFTADVKSHSQFVKAFFGLGAPGTVGDGNNNKKQGD